MTAPGPAPALDTLPLAELFERAASTDPAPGGGAVTALTARLGIALILKALRISVRGSDESERHAGIDSRLTALAAAFAADADADGRAFDDYVRAARLPRASEAEAAERSEALRRAAVAATEAALATLRHARDAYAASVEMEAAVKASIRADLVAGRELLKVARLVAVENAETNLRALKREEDRAPLLAALAAAADPAAFG
ncbi:MAG: cyclodeaminase/cyclohydrolase family protein [Alphaproteobacteria bacterium]|nr:cyclodeaminase/cyclohydrolase family protein [Alphaproteobacteria bacterium]MBV9370226.1 cyclodeaminase/cyclohydrolase family protein [Alphaproteobacteria bacterium]MBV9899711.1 cyclodeaminase/cyclohydrolase family protein [Alphaproteobacteria bacterium]